MNTTVCRIPVTSSIVARPPAARPFKPAVTALKRNIVIVRADPAPDAVETAIKGAEEACKDGSTGECAAAWDEVRWHALHNLSRVSSLCAPRLVVWCIEPVACHIAGVRAPTLVPGVLRALGGDHAPTFVVVAVCLLSRLRVPVRHVLTCLGSRSSTKVEEISAAIAHKKAAKAAESTDPLDKLCEEEPDAAECRVYED